MSFYRQIRCIFIALGLVMVLGTGRPVLGAVPRHVINLVSSLEPMTVPASPAGALSGKTLYLDESVVDGKRWYRLRAGFFASPKEAEAVLDALQGKYPDAWVTRAPKSERAAVVGGLKAPAAKSADEKKSPAGGEKKSSASNDLAILPVSGRHVINLRSSLDPLEVPRPAPGSPLAGRILYLDETVVKGQRWHRLRAGFFASAAEAQSVSAEIKSHYPEAWVTRAPKSERAAALAGRRPAQSAPAVKPLPVAEEGAGSIASSPSLLPAEGRHVINLRSSLTPLTVPRLSPGSVLAGRVLYLDESVIRGQRWYRLRAGFFASAADAGAMLPALKKAFPEAWVTRAPRSEMSRQLEMARNRVAVSLPVPEAVREKRIAVASSGGQAVAGTEKAARKVVAALDAAAVSADTTAVMEEARVAMVAGNYRQAAILYQRVLVMDDAAVLQQAQELLGLAREKDGKYAHAKAEYEKYLSLYPEGPDAVRVRQRLASLVTAAAAPKAKLRKAKQQPLEEEGWHRDLYGSFSQFYDRDETYLDSGEHLMNRSGIDSDLDLGYRMRNQDYDLRFQFNGGHEFNFLDDGENDETIARFYLDFLDRRRGLSGRVGRQMGSSGGVIGRFDGAVIGYQATPLLRVNLVGGFPVSSASDTTVDSDRNFYGVNVDIGTIARHWDSNLFYLEQNADGILDRRAVGGEVRYFDERSSFFGLADYDLHFSKLSTLLLVGNRTLETGTVINYSADFRRSAFLTTSNALQGQAVRDLEVLRETFSEDEIRQLALDRTAISRSATLGATHPFSDRFQIGTDVTVSSLSGTGTSAGVEGMEGTGNEYFYSLQFIGSSLLKENDVAILGLRYADTSSADRYSVSFNSRYPVTRELRLNPRVQLDYRENKDGDGEQWRLRPSLRVHYRWKKRFHLEFEGGTQWTSDVFNLEEEDTRGYFARLGYRVDF